MKSERQTTLALGCVPPLREEEKKLLAAFREIDSLKKSIEHAANSDLLVLGVGDLNAADSQAMRMFKSLGIHKRTQIDPHRAVAEINLSILNKEGADLSNIVFTPSTSLSQFWQGSHPWFLGLGIEQIQAIASRKHSIVLVVANNARKAPAIEAAIAANLVNCLVTDLETAEALIRRSNKRQ